MKKIIFYIILSSFISSMMSITAYKKYIEKDPIRFPSCNNNNKIYPYSNSSFIRKKRIFSNKSSYLKPFSDYNISSESKYVSSNPDFTKAVNKTINSVVNINNYSKTNGYDIDDSTDPLDLFFGFPYDYFNDRKNNDIEKEYDKNDVPEFHGSGVIISDNGYIVTNYHVIKNAKKIEVVLNNQKNYIAKLIGTDPSTDIALLKINEKELPFVIFSDSDKVKIGEWVLAIGNPFNLNSTVTAGIISAKNRDLGILNDDTDYSIESFLQTDAAVNPGNSGGPLINTNGNLIGINTAISSHSGNFIGYSFATPSNLVLKVVKDIMKYGSVKRAFLGIKGVDLSKSDFLKFYNRKNNKNIKPQFGLLVEKVFNGGSAYYAGIKNEDIIKNIDNKQIQNIGDVSFIVGMKKPGEKINIVVLRNGKIKNFNNVVLKNI
ncbi:S1C family serine protease [Blattabacterium cuenoti]|uniref:S1C family serine protease n=1 Tax=Blattabacterium cuenoti TaxID=1653831 RepID=UPI00163BE601|nr:trypsin-like peptidase domain-containing protein [Blattabacterium cuenoti]